ncbi:hypothetical protein GCM10010317_058080 [Streptomyces mirabilis]|nr:hypothetical protein GCM10010317_058080 [Streptomyces mirabilis]
MDCDTHGDPRRIPSAGAPAQEWVGTIAVSAAVDAAVTGSQGHTGTGGRIPAPISSTVRNRTSRPADRW